MDSVEFCRIATNQHCRDGGLQVAIEQFVVYTLAHQSAVPFIKDLGFNKCLS